MALEAADDRRAVADVARTLIDRRVVSKSLHGNISARLPGADLLLMSGSSLAALTEERLAVVDLDGDLVDGHLEPAEFEVVAMHTAMYRERPSFGCVVHTHSPAATAFAVATRALPVVAESLARWGVTREIPVAAWAPRGSPASVDNIVEVLRAAPAAPAVLLENHGVLVGGADPTEALRRSIAIEENAELAILAERLGGARAMTPEQAEAAVARRRGFLEAGPD